jgi:hypothetical protein
VPQGIGALLGVTAVMLMADLEEAKYVAAFASGLQNGVLTVTTGFARTTHVTGTVTDVGLLVGQVRFCRDRFSLPVTSDTGR